MSSKRDAEVAVVGAGPVGLLTAVALADADIGVQIFDAGRRTAEHSYALVLHPSTLELLDTFGVGAACREAGRDVGQVAVYEDGERRERFDFSRLPGPQKHVVVLPQSKLEVILESALKDRGIAVRWDHRVQGIEDRAGFVELTVARLDKVSTGYPIAHTETVVDKLYEIHARYVVAADGYDSFVRRRLAIPFEPQGLAQIYSVFQFATGAGAPAEGRLMLEGRTIGGYWPLPGGRCRFSFPVATAAEHDPEPACLRERLAARAPWFRSEIGEIEWTAVGLFERKLAARFGEGRIWLAGDAAHVTGPLGGQSMNVGLREAVDLAARIARLKRYGTVDEVFGEYAASRAEEWHALFGPPADCGSRRSLLLPCLPASGGDLDVLLEQLNS